ncbi:MAG TPA: ankyrin repeat domain-containing protein [Bryobacteraceae bacterium]|nr:ankyrin repeat domain-containing protein [Bryobacteraceae bacterium]
MKIIGVLAGLGLVASAFGASSEVADAAQRRDWAAVRSLAARQAGVNAAQPDGTTALQWAAHWNDADSVKLLLAAGANPKLANRYGVSPLSEAAGAGNAAIIEMLLQAGADPKTLTTADGETVLMTAARTGSVAAVKVLLEHGADVNAKENYRGQTALMWAAAERHADVAKLLLEHGADWKMQSQSRETNIPKLSAASSITPLARGGLTAFHFAAREGDIATGRVMLDAGVDINQVDADNTSALVVALLNKRYTYAKFLLDRGADPNLADVRGRAALYAAIDMRNQDYSAMPAHKEDDPLPSLELIQALLDHGANTNAQLVKNIPGRSGMDAGDTTLGAGATPLMRAARAGDAAVMRALLAKGADPNLTTRDGNTALQFAAGVGYRDKNTKGTESEALEALKVAVGLGLDLNRENNRGETALHGAAERGGDTLVQYLADHGARLDAKTKQGFTPLDYAMGKNITAQLPVPHDSTVTLIRKLGGVEGKPVKAVAASQ